VRAHCVVVVRGNHDKVSTGQEDLEWFNPVARAAALWTQQNLTPANIEYIRAFQRAVLLDGFQVLHGSPFDEDEYVMPLLKPGRLRLPREPPGLFRAQPTCRRLHLEPLACGNHPGNIHAQPPAGDGDRRRVRLPGEPGFGGPPRDGDPRSAYILYDSAARLVALLPRSL